MNNTQSIKETQKSERLGYYAYFFGQNMIFFIVLMYIAFFYTDFYGIKPAHVAMIMLGARIWDAINDPLLTAIVERTRIGEDKYKPWIRLVVILMPLSTILLFLNPEWVTGWSYATTVTFATVTYVLWGMIYTVSDAPAFALSTVMTHNVEERTTIITGSRIFAMVGGLFTIVLSTQLLGATDNNWMIAAIFVSVIAFVFLAQFRLVKERVRHENNVVTLGMIFKAVFKNTLLLRVAVFLLLMYFLNVGFALNAHLAKHVLGNEQYTGLLMFSAFLPIFIVGAFIPVLVRKFGKRKITIFSTSMGIILSFAVYFAGYNSLPVFFALITLRAVAFAPFMIIGSLYFADSVEYGEYHTGERYEGMSFAAQTFTTKASQAFAGAIGMAMLSVVNFKESTGGSVTQSQSTIDGIWDIYNLLPIFGYVLALIFFIFTIKVSESEIERMAKANDSIRESNFNKEEVVVNG